METKKLMLDAGHGLKTVGKQTPDGIKEFTLNQKVVDYIAANLKDYNVEIKYSHDRTGATDVALTERVRACNNYKPDLFVSIHHNAHLGTWGTATGTEVYWHTRGTAADREVAGLVAPKLAAYTGLRNRGVKTAEFTVLTCNATAILVEGGFMDTRTDHAVITSVAGQKAYAQAVSEVIIDYLKLTKKATTTTYTVVAGDTLGAIARKFGTTVEEIVRLNNLADPNRISIGQKLVIAARTHTIVAGDTLSAIAKRFDTTVDAIVKANNLADANKIAIGQILLIP